MSDISRLLIKCMEEYKTTLDVLVEGKPRDILMEEIQQLKRNKEEVKNGEDN